MTASLLCRWNQVGYGDIAPVTDMGRIAMVVLIIVMLIEVPVQINAIGSYFESGS